VTGRTAHHDSTDVRPRTGCMARVWQENPIFTNRPIGLVSLLQSCALVEIELMIGLFSVFEVMEPQGNYMEELYYPGEYKLTWMLCCYFSCIARILYMSNMHDLRLS
jgi:hypothetical protein